MKILHQKLRRESGELESKMSTMLAFFGLKNILLFGVNEAAQAKCFVNFSLGLCSVRDKHDFAARGSGDLVVVVHGAAVVPESGVWANLSPKYLNLVIQSLRFENCFMF